MLSEELSKLSCYLAPLPPPPPIPLFYPPLFLFSPPFICLCLPPSPPPSLPPLLPQQPTSSIRESQLTSKPRKTFRENKELLESFHNHFEVGAVVLCCGLLFPWQSHYISVCYYLISQALAELTRRIATFERNYLIVEVESLLQDTAQKLESIAKQASNVC